MPLLVLCGTMPRTVRQNILLGALKWKGPREGFTLHRFFKNLKYFTSKCVRAYKLNNMC